MNYKWAKDFTLELLNQYSVAGALVPESYNNQADYLLRIPKLLNDAQMCVATTYGRIKEVVHMSELEQTEKGVWTEYVLPEDCWRVCQQGVLLLTDEDVKRLGQYRLIGRDRLMLRTPMAGELLLEYYRYPKLLDIKPLDSAELDNTREAQMTLPYYVASHLVMADNEFVYQALYNEFEAKLARLYEEPDHEMGYVEDQYWGAGGFADV